MPFPDTEQDFQTMQDAETLKHAEMIKGDPERLKRAIEYLQEEREALAQAEAGAKLAARIS